MGDFVVYLAALVAPVVFAFAGWRLKRAYDSRAGGRRTFFLVVGNVCVLLLLVSLLFLAAESYYRFWYDDTDAFAVTRTTVRWGQRHYRLNNFGVRDDVDYSLKKSDNRRRTLFLGDSFTAGHGVENVDDRFLNRLRRVNGDRWELHLLGENGADTGSHLLRAQKAAFMGYEADLFVLVYCPNDIHDILPERDEMIHRILQHIEGTGFFVQHSFAANTFYFRWIAVRDPAISRYYESVRDAYFGPVWETQKSRLVALAAACRAREARFAVVLFPFLQDLDDPKYQEIQARMTAFWQSQGVPVLDLLPIFAAHPDESFVVNRYDGHPNERAHELAAEAIGKFLDSLERGP
jgi:lysophospholipase L1-like esterase